MKLLKSFVLLFASVSLMSCGSDDDSSSIPPFELTTESLTGSYALNELAGEEVEIVTLNSSGDEVEETITVFEGSLFTSATVALLSDQTFTFTGSYALMSEKSIDGSVVEDENNRDGIVVLEDSGTYVLNSEDELITFTSVNKQILEGDYDIELSEENMSLKQVLVNVDDTETTTSTEISSEFTYSFDRQ